MEIRKDYVRRVSRTLSSVYRKNLLTGGCDRVFDCVLIVAAYHDNQRRGFKPVVRKVFPPDAKYPENIAMFCFPDVCNWKGNKEDIKCDVASSYSIVFTNEKGERSFGYCKRIQPGNEDSVPLAYCILSKIRAHGFYDKV
jgi:hypothetical protein